MSALYQLIVSSRAKGFNTLQHTSRLQSYSLTFCMISPLCAAFYIRCYRTVSKGVAMKPYLISLFAGLLVGGIYGILNVKSPAPPTIALIGLLGILLGEQAVPIARQLFAGQSSNPSAHSSASSKGDNL